MIPEEFAVVGAVIGSIGGFVYLFETIVGRTRPNRMTWFLWFLFPMIIFIAQRAQGVEGISWASFAAGFTPLLILFATFLNRNAYWRTEPRDYVLMAAALGGIGLWAITDDPNLALLFSLIADFIAGIPTFIKAYRHPETESWLAYAISSVGFGIGVLAVQSYTFESAAFVAYLFVMNGLLAVFASRRPAALAPTRA